MLLNLTDLWDYCVWMTSLYYYVQFLYLLKPSGCLCTIKFNIQKFHIVLTLSYLLFTVP
jgi:hypothetical protein